MGGTPDDEFIAELQQVDFQPVFILGVHRSGTSILYKMLVATGSFNSITAYHIIQYHELLANQHQHLEEHARQQLTETLREQGLQDRKIDRMTVTADFAEEYGFLLNERTIRMYLSPRNVILFRELCKKIQFLAENKKPLLMKNPYDFSHFLYIKKVFPNAKFIFIHRNPIKTISSTLKAFQVIFEEKHPYMAHLSRMYDKFYTNPLLRAPFRMVFCHVPEFGVMYITRTTAKATQYYLENIRKLPAEDYIALTYEEFCLDPQKTIDRIMQKLSVPMQTPVDAAALMRPRKVDIDKTVLKLRPYLTRSLKKYCETFRYSFEKEAESSVHQ
jgi:LPS sulfotransferase NodH